MPTPRTYPPTELQLTTLAWIRSFIEQNGMPPTMREIGKAFEVKSVNAISQRLHAMAKKGLLQFTPRASRSWRPA